MKPKERGCRSKAWKPNRNPMPDALRRLRAGEPSVWVAFGGERLELAPYDPAVDVGEGNTGQGGQPGRGGFFLLVNRGRLSLGEMDHYGRTYERIGRDGRSLRVCRGVRYRPRILARIVQRHARRCPGVAPG